MTFNHVGVVGSGQMGAGIAQVAATFGCQVVLYDHQQTQLQRAEKTIQTSAEKLAAKSKITPEQRDAVMTKIVYAADLGALSACDFVVEAIVENEQAKMDLYRKLSETLQEQCVLATNTSSIAITKLAAGYKDPSRFLGVHFMNPVPIMALVEVIPGMLTDQSVLSRALTWLGQLQKQVVQSRDFPGFIVNRILMPMINEAFMALGDGIATAEEIDSGMKLGTNQPMGPLTLADFIGLDTCLAIMNVLHQGFGDSKYRPSPLLQQYVQAGLLGRKTKRGVYQY